MAVTYSPILVSILFAVGFGLVFLALFSLVYLRATRSWSSE